VQQLNAEVAKILALPEVRRKAEDAGTTVETMSAAQLGDYTRAELEHWGRVIRASRITAD
jgi:tripartite-type tricarboxylate transporter receptor subunit TctC